MRRTSCWSLTSSFSSCSSRSSGGSADGDEQYGRIQPDVCAYVSGFVPTVTPRACVRRLASNFYMSRRHGERPIFFSAGTQACRRVTSLVRHFGKRDSRTAFLRRLARQEILRFGASNPLPSWNPAAAVDAAVFGALQPEILHRESACDRHVGL